jgi:hypothetical protein
MDSRWFGRMDFTRFELDSLLDKIVE